MCPQCLERKTLTWVGCRPCWRPGASPHLTSQGCSGRGCTTSSLTGKPRCFNELSSPLERDKGRFKLYLYVRSMAPSTMSRAQQLITGLQASGDESRLVFLCLSLSIHDRCSNQTAASSHRDVPAPRHGPRRHACRLSCQDWYLANSSPKGLLFIPPNYFILRLCQPSSSF